MLEKLFKLHDNKTSIKTEVIAGLTTFLAMAYILAVNPGMLSQTGMNEQGVFLATAISSGIACLLMGVLANYPVALAPGMGVNAFFTYTVCLTYGFSWQAALAAVFVSGLIFLFISVTGIRKHIINSIPKNLKLAIGAGIGFFIAFIGFKNAGMVVANPATFVGLGDFKDPTVLLSIIGIIITVILIARKVNGAVFFGIVLTAMIGIIMGAMGLVGVSAPLPTTPSGVFSLDLDFSLIGSFVQGFQELFSSSKVVLVIFSFLFVDFFDTAGTLVAIGNKIGLVNEAGEMKNIEKALLADSVGTVVGATLGTSTVTSFIESGSGVAAGGRTGLTAVVTGVCFFLSVLFYPLLGVVTSAVTAPSLIIVGVLMAQQLGQIEWDDFSVSVAAFITIITMILSYSISDGIAVGFLAYTIMQLASGKMKDIKWVVYVLDIIFIINFIV
ncbi:NCS2 family permease [Erysipelotrichaceae bacterium OH741_COT-311]|nr:NCS2 family permease [Erysipelotrichaceae bacterium OH741_COT-311]